MGKLATDKQFILDAWCADTLSMAVKDEKEVVVDEAKSKAEAMMEALGPLLTETILDEAMAAAKAKSVAEAEEESRG